MRCLRIYATPDGESHFGEVDIAMTMTPAFPNVAPFELSAYYPASRIRFAHIPAGVREAGFHTPPDRLLAIWLDGHVEFETSDGEVRRLPAGKAVLVERTGKNTSHATPRKDRTLSQSYCRAALAHHLISRLLARTGPTGSVS